MLLAIDIGNTNINFGIFEGSKLAKRFFIATKGYQLKKLRNLSGKLDINDSIICSVVPAVTKILKQDLTRLLSRQPYIIGKDIKMPIKNLYRKPKQVGDDRLVNAYAGIMLYGAPLIAVDFGTAVTFDVVSKNKEYLGGMILPGLGISLDALNQRTALLPMVKLEEPREFIGRDTRSSMLSGIVYGFAALTDDLVIRIKNKIGKEAKVIGTGGNIGLIGKYCRQIDKIDKDLTLKGLNLIYRNLLDLDCTP
ncbi:MAG: type III pantothenate kinase [Candidatus Omnitrophota bacterium]|nr:type III pantothenate kinase [Candidatus Omnitrophota bacterium]